MIRKVTAPPADRPDANGPDSGSTPSDVVSAGFWHDSDCGERIVCDLCPRACSLKPGDRGFCFVRENRDGQMVLTTYGRSTGFCIDPIEKKPLNHFYPGSSVLSFGTAGCNLGCKFCQNWDISKSREVARASETATPETIARAARELGCQSVAFTYNDPVIWAEYAVATARACRAAGIKTVAVTAGYITPEARPYFFRDIDAANVDLKAFSERFYQQLTYSHLQPVLDTLVWLKQETDIWFELTTLIIPEENDSPDELRRMCGWIVEHLGEEVPVHFTAFHPDFRLQNRPSTPLATLLEAYEIARSAGIRYAYVGNVHDPVHDSTFCPRCGAMLIERNWHQLGRYQLHENRCGKCEQVIPGRFAREPGQWGRRRQVVRIADYATAVGGHQLTLQSAEPVRAGQATDAGTAANVASASGSAGQLSAAQQRAVLQAACEVMAAGLLPRPLELTDPSWGGVAGQPVMGAFVTLKRQGHLRACCGTVGQPTTLSQAVRRAAERTATDDQRLAPISPAELPYLDVDISLLSRFRRIEARAQRRVAAVQIGRHGLTIRLGQHSGLLLPNVAVENEWDSECFLRQVCRKAGLPAHAWLEDAAELETFETELFGGPFAAALLAGVLSAPPALVSDNELTLLSEHCRTNIVALARGATPNYYLPSCQDTNVQGVVLSIRLTGQTAHAQFARLSLRPGLPLQSTLFQLCESAAQWLGSADLAAGWAHELTVQVAVLADSSMHGTVAEPDLRGVVPDRALIVVQNGRYAWRYDPCCDGAELLKEAATDALVYDPRTASILSFAIRTNAPTLRIDLLPRPQPGPAKRPCAVAGTFYPDHSQAIQNMVSQLTAQKPAEAPRRVAAVLVPHAGWRFSGPIAAQVFQRVVLPPRVIVLAPRHSRHGVPWAVAPHQAWQIPGHEIASDVQLARQLAASIPRLQLDAAAHREEHAIEVHLPLLAHLAPQTRVVGITVGEGDWEACYSFAEQLAAVLRDDPDRPLLVISSDLNHYAAEALNRQLDRIALDALCQLDPAHLMRTVRSHDISMCGLLPAVIVLQTLRNLGALHTCTEVAYGTSADAGGSPERVVGYAGLLFD